MPRDTIRRLAVDIERILVAGAHLAAADPNLAKDKKALDALATQLGAKAPVIGQLAAATAKAMAAKGTESARELVALATMTAQVRAAQAQPAPVTALAPLTPRPEIGTPCSAKALGELYGALTENGKGRLERVQKSIDRGDIADIRLVDALIHAMNDSYIGDLVADKAVPRLGPAVIAPIRSSLQFEKARKIDCRRLRALVAVDAAGSCDLLLRALAEGTAELRKSALESIAEHVRGDPQFEAPVLALITKERSGDVFSAALRALGGYSSDATLKALIIALDDLRTVEAAAEGLGRSRHPKSLEFLLDRLALAVTAIKNKEKKDPAVKAPAYSVEPEHLVKILLAALAEQRDPRIATAAMPLIKQHGVAAAEAALGSADAKQLTTIADLLNGSDAVFFPVAAKASAKLDEDKAFKRLSMAFTAKDREQKIGQQRLAAVVSQVRDAPDPRWADLCLKQLDSPAATAAIQLLGSLKEKRAILPLVTLVDVKLKGSKPDGRTHAAMAALGAIGDPIAIPAILSHHTSEVWTTTSAMEQAIIAIDHPDAVDQVRTILFAQRDPDSSNLRSLLTHLERRFPGK